VTVGQNVPKCHDIGVVISGVFLTGAGGVLIYINHECASFPKMQEPLKNSCCQEGDMKEVPF
jgi:hypothetical protein